MIMENPFSPAGRWIAGLDSAMEIMLIAQLAFMPLAMGVVDAWSQLALVGWTAAMSVVLCVRLAIRPVAPRLVVLPLAGVLALAAFQLVSLPAGVLDAISPGTLELKRTLLDEPSLERAAISFYPSATAQALRLGSAMLVTFIIGLLLSGESRRRRHLLWAVSIIGAGCAALALAQVALGATRVFWLVPTHAGLADGGPFINRSNYCQMANLSIAAAMALLLPGLGRLLDEAGHSAPAALEKLVSPQCRPLWLLAGMIVLMASSVFMSLSRGGMLSLIIASGVTALALALSRGLRGSGWAMAGLATACLVCVTYLGFDAVYERLGSLRHVSEAQAGRWQIVRNIAGGWKPFASMGAGLGAHEMVYPMLDSSATPGLAQHAENEYVQAAEELGTAGLTLLCAFGLLVGRSWWRVVRRGGPDSSAAIGLGMGLLAAMLHSLSDFGQRLPANASLSLLLAGAIVAMDAPAERKPLAALKLRRRTWLAIAALAPGLVLAWTSIVKGAAGHALAEHHWRRALRIEKLLAEADWQGSNNDYRLLISSAKSAVDAAPADVNYRYWLNVYRWRALARSTDASGNVLLDDQGRRAVEMVVADLLQCRRLAPTFGPAQSLAGQLNCFVLDNADGQRLVERALDLAPYAPTVAMASGVLACRQGRFDDALERFRRCVRLSKTMFGEIADALISAHGQAQLAVDLAGDDFEMLLEVSRILARRPAHEQLARRCRDRAKSILEELTARGASANILRLLAGLYSDDGEHDLAIAALQKALELDFGNVQWRLMLARELQLVGRLEEARRQSDLCLRLSPQDRSARALSRRLASGPLKEDDSR